VIRLQGTDRLAQALFERHAVAALPAHGQVGANLIDRGRVQFSAEDTGDVATRLNTLGHLRRERSHGHRQLTHPRAEAIVPQGPLRQVPGTMEPAHDGPERDPKDLTGLPEEHSSRFEPLRDPDIAKYPDIRLILF
jgi:hypothetical protein